MPHLTTVDQGILSGALTGLVHKYVRESFAAPADAWWLDDEDGNHQPVIRVRLPHNTFLIVTTHVEGGEEEMAKLLAYVAREAGNTRLARLLDLVGAGVDDTDISTLLGGG